LLKTAREQSVYPKNMQNIIINMNVRGFMYFVREPKIKGRKALGNVITVNNKLNSICVISNSFSIRRLIKLGKLIAIKPPSFDNAPK